MQLSRNLVRENTQFQYIKLKHPFSAQRSLFNLDFLNNLLKPLPLIECLDSLIMQYSPEPAIQTSFLILAN